MQRDTMIFLTLLGALLAAIVCGVSSYLLPHIALIWKISGALSVVLAITYGVLQHRFFGEIFSKRTARYGLNSILMSIVALLIVIVINRIASEHDWKKDFTKNQLHGLSDETMKVLKNLKAEVIFRPFIYPTQQHEYDKVFEKYSYYSKLIKKEYIDLDKDPSAVQRFGIKQANMIIIESQTRTARVENAMGPEDPKLEEKLTNAIIQVAKGEKKKIYFISGHGERLVSDSGRDGYSEIKETLEGGRYRTEELVLLEKDKIPPDADILVCIGPKSDFMEHELKLLEEYTKIGGKVLILLDPVSTATLKPFLAKYGADWRPKKTVLETNRLQQLAGGNPLAPIVTSYDPSHEITQEAKQLSIFPIPTPVEKAATPPSGYKVSSLFSTSTRSIEVELKGDKVTVNEKSDRKGPISLGVAISGKIPGEKKGKDKKEVKPAEPAKSEAKKSEEKKPEVENEFRMVVVGASSFGSNSVRKFGINADLFQNILSWLSKEEDLISIHPRPTDTSEFEITEERARIIYLASVVFFPFSMFLSGIAVWASRRKR